MLNETEKLKANGADKTGNYKLFKAVETSIEKTDFSNKKDVDKLNYLLDNLTDSQSLYVNKNLVIETQNMKRYEDCGLSSNFINKYKDDNKNILNDSINIISRELIEMNSIYRDGNLKFFNAELINDQFNKLNTIQKDLAIFAISDRVETLPKANELGGWLKQYGVEDNFIKPFVISQEINTNDRAYERIKNNSFQVIDNFLNKGILDKERVETVIKNDFKKLPVNEITIANKYEYKNKFVSDLSKNYRNEFNDVINHLNNEIVLGYDTKQKEKDLSIDL